MGGTGATAAEAGTKQALGRTQIGAIGTAHTAHSVTQRVPSGTHLTTVLVATVAIAVFITGVTLGRSTVEELVSVAVFDTDTVGKSEPAETGEAVESRPSVARLAGGETLLAGRHGVEVVASCAVVGRLDAAAVAVEGEARLASGASSWGGTTAAGRRALHAAGARDSEASGTLTQTVAFIEVVTRRAGGALGGTGTCVTMGRTTETTAQHCVEIGASRTAGLTGNSAVDIKQRIARTASGAGGGSASLAVTHRAGHTGAARGVVARGTS